MNEYKIKEQICDIGRRVWQREYVAANDGNFSVRVSENRVLATPTMISKGFMDIDDIVTLDMEGNQLGGNKKPTSETQIHLQIYKDRPDVKSVIHVHPPRATAFAVAQKPIPKCVLPEVEVFLGEIPIAQYGTPGTQEFADTIRPYLKDFNLFLLANHGALSLGEDIIQAYYRMEIVEQYCRILLYTQQLGSFNQITEDKMQELFKMKTGLGYSDRRLAPGGDTSCALPSPTPANLNSSQVENQNDLEKTITDTVIRVLKEKGQL